MRTLLYILPILLLAGCGTESEPIPTYQLTVNAEPEEAGTVSYFQQTEYKEGTPVELTANPANGWSFLEWKGDAFGDDNPYSIVMESNKTVTAVFEEMVLEMWICGTICDVTDPEAKKIELPWGNSFYYPEDEQINKETTLERYLFRVLGGQFTIVDVNVESDNSAVDGWWSGLEEGMIIEKGENHLFSINGKKTEDVPSELIFSFKVKDTRIQFTRWAWW